MPRSQLRAPGSSTGDPACSSIYLFERHRIYIHGLLLPPGARRSGTLLPGPLMFQRRDGEMVLGVAAAVGYVRSGGGGGGGALVISPQEPKGGGCGGQAHA